jgi:hypothetical protein
MDRPNSTEPEQPGGVEQQLGARLEDEDVQGDADQDILETGVEDSPGQLRESLQEAAEQADPH